VVETHRLGTYVTRRLVEAGAAAVLLSRAATAWAGDAPSVDDIKQAESDFNHGRESYKGGSYSEAAEYFESADSHAPNDRVIELAINARDRAGQLDRAATLAQLAIDRYPNSDRLRKLAGPLIERARTEDLAVTVDCDEACTLLDGERLIHGDAMTHRIVFLPPGDHTLRAGWSEDRSDEKPVTGKAGDAPSLTFAAPPLPKKEEAPAAPVPAANPLQDQGERPTPKPLPPLVFWSGLGATAVLGGITIWSGVDTLNNPGKDKVRAACAGGQTPACTSVYNQGRDHQTRTNILIGATSVAGAATAVIGVLFTDWAKGGSSESAPESASIVPWIDYAGGPSVGASGRF
jgi:hypothetical protein